METEMKSVHLRKENIYTVYFIAGEKEYKIADVYSYDMAERLSKIVAKVHGVDWRDIKNDIADKQRNYD